MTIPMVLLVSLVPVYLLIASRASRSSGYAPAIQWDRQLPLVPTWALVYGALYAFLIVLPVIVVQQQELIRRTVWAYLTVWIVSYICFLFFPTFAPRPDTLTGNGFGVWGLQFLYNADPPYNCFPSLHVAHSFVSALACYCVNRSLGFAAIACAFLVALSTLFTKQHYVADVVGGMVLALAAYAVFLRGACRARVPEFERRVAPILALIVAGIVGAGFASFWVAYKFGVTIA